MTGYGHTGTPRPSLIVDETGKIFGQWTVLSRGTNNSRGTVRWICRCVCGKDQEVEGYALRSGKSSQCKSCALRGRRTGTGAFRKAYNLYKSRASKMNCSFPLSLEEFMEFVTKNCHYCGEPPSTVKRAYNRPSSSGIGPDDSAKFHGIDRVDSSKSYERGNIVVCCFLCNGMKSNKDLDTFLSHVIKIAEHIKKGGGYSEKPSDV